jgi:hypothetical protein
MTTVRTEDYTIGNALAERWSVLALHDDGSSVREQIVGCQRPSSPRQRHVQTCERVLPSYVHAWNSELDGVSLKQAFAYLWQLTSVIAAAYKLLIRLFRLLSLSACCCVRNLFNFPTECFYRKDRTGAAKSQACIYSWRNRLVFDLL